jgi:hypothetical protein
VGSCDFDALLVSCPLIARPEVVLFTSLLGGNCAGLLAGLESIGAADP